MEVEYAIFMVVVFAIIGILIWKQKTKVTEETSVTNEIPDLTDDIAEAKTSLEPYCSRLLGLIQLLNIFISAKQMAAAYISNFEQLSYQAKLSFTKGIVVDYAKPWTGNRSSALKAIETSKGYDFLGEVEHNAIHGEILELRHRLIAHIDEGYEGLSITLAGGSVLNINPNRPRDEGTLEDVFIPTVVRLGSVRGMWWIENLDKLNEMLQQINFALTTTQNEITSSSKAFLHESLNFMHVLKEIPDIVNIHEFPSAEFNVTVQKYAENPGSLNIDAPVTLKFGDGNIQSLLVVYESTPGFEQGLTVDGKGYSFIIGEEQHDGKLQMKVVFPIYPHPRGT